MPATTNVWPPIGDVTLASGETQDVTLADAATNSVSTVQTLTHTTSGTAAAGFGSAFLWKGSDGAGNTDDMADVQVVWTDATSTSEDSKIVFRTRLAGAALAEAARFDGKTTILGGGTPPYSNRLTVTGDADGNSWIIVNSSAANAGQLLLGVESNSNPVFMGSISNHSVALRSNNTARTTWDTSGNLIHGTAAIATTATSGFLYIPACAGAPTGVPTAFAGRVPLVVDSTNNKLYFYSGGAWRDAGP